MPKVAPRTAASALYCTDCGVHLTKAQEELFRSTYDAVCRECGLDMYDSTIGLKVKHSSGKYLYVKNVRESHWYHATAVEDWSRDIPPELKVHLGTRHSAMSRWEDISLGEDGWLYKLKLTPNVPIHRSVVKDDHIDPSAINSKSMLEVVRYVNLLESVGSISLIAHRHHFEVVSVKRLPRTR